jgi:hypothetical protein
MTGIISKKNAFEFATDVVVTSLFCWGFDKKYPLTNRMHFLALSVVHMVVRRSLIILGHKAAHALTEKAGYVTPGGNITNHKFFHLNNALSTCVMMSMLVSYQSIGQRFNLQFPDMFKISGLLSFNVGISVCVIHATYAFIPSLANAK